MTKAMLTKGGNPAQNQFEIGTSKALYFRSYGSIVAKKESGKVYLDKYYWDYSVTTGKYRNQFLNEGIAETRRKIESGEYILCDLDGEGIK